ncbi:SusC/RagA family TonB-linked outer membrane protein [Chryseosolibacter indicus]|uniref:TonB-dependent receptor n=1 Tax=Chryseosolibacter indicus TaxID=2782351 RepID=A0ABS5VWK0_9BACT|nr:TonB-dependent receptor [Chryseosolibacter indicus]MBT1705611.1 TonB-dependent receptor [Chryseosolibacter indicus]
MLKPIRTRSVIRKLFLLFTLHMFCLGFAKAQNQVSGKVTSQMDNQALPGVSIVIKGTSQGIVSDANGDYRLGDIPADAVLVFSFIGYITEEVPLNGQTRIDVSMQLNVAELSEIVIVGYGAVKKSDVTGAVVKMSSDKITALPVQNTLQALQGRAAGLDVTSNARPGEIGTIRIRGTRSLSAGNDPLYVVDGIPLQSGGIEAFNPNDIESIEVLKDASASAIYGSRAANGVILITTKKGKDGKAQVNYTGSVYFEKINDRMEMFNAGEYAEYRRNAYRAMPSNNTARYPTPFPNPADDKRILGVDPYAWESVAAGYTWLDKDNLVPAMRPTTPEEQALWGVAEVPVYDASRVPTTNWTDYVERTGITQDHNVSVSMGTEKLKTFFSAGYLDQKGTSNGQDYKRYSSRLNLDFTPLKWLSMGGSMMASYGIQNFGYAGSGTRGSRTIYEAAKGMLPFAVPYDPAGNYIFNPGGDVGIINPIREDDYVINERRTLRLMGSFYGEAKITEGLKFRVNFGPDFRNYRNGEFQYKESALRGGGSSSSTTYARYQQNQQISWTLENLLFYDKTFATDHHIGITLLQSSSLYRTESSDMTATAVPYNSQLWYNLKSTSTGSLNDWGSGFSKRNLMSYMARVNYAFKDRYLLTAAGRYDGASVLAPGNKWDFFPSMAIAWKINEEPFMSGIRWISELKPRIGLGTVGNQSVDPYSTAGGLVQLPYVFGSTPAIGFVPSNPKGAANEQGSIPNPQLGWEKTSQWNFGVDFGFVNNRITGSLDYYIANTYDMILNRTPNSVTGYSNITVNIGETENRGIDLMLSSINIDHGGFRWTTDIIFSRNRGKIVELYGNGVSDINKAWFIGQPLQVYYDYKKIGIWQAADAEEMKKFNDNGAKYAAGDIRVEDVNNDYRIDQNNDRQILGTSNPKWNGGITNTFSYKNIDLSFFIYSRWGQMMEGGAVDMQGRYASRKVDYWTPTNPTNAYPRADFLNGGQPVHYTAMNYIDGSFIKVRYITLGYRFPDAIASRAGMSNLRIYTQVLNPFLYAKVDFFDPDVNFQNIQPNTSGSTNTSGSAISSRSLVFGLNATF